jgi:uncharacterized membrane protein YukC
MSTLNLIIIIIFIVISYLCYEKWRSNKILEQKSIETYKNIVEQNYKKKQTHIKRIKSTPIKKLPKSPIKNISLCYFKIKGMGDIHIQLFDNIVPQTAENFRLLCKNKKYKLLPTRTCS